MIVAIGFVAKSLPIYFLRILCPAWSQRDVETLNRQSSSRFADQRVDSIADFEWRDQKRYTGIPRTTSARPGHVYCGLYRNSTMQIHDAMTM
jgi:hypothetical protein